MKQFLSTYHIRIKTVLLAMLVALFFGNLLGTVTAAKEIPEHFVRFHIIANSNSREDQWVKQEIRRRIFASLDFSTIHSKEDALQYFQQNKCFVESIADEVLQENGFFYKSQVTVGKKAFPIREYSDFVLPSGIYDAVSVKLGEGVGQNYFCVMYPSLCMIEGVRETTDSNAEVFRHVLSEREAQTITGDKKTVIAKFKIAEIFEKLLQN